jgi:RimK-like ATP-grasp domain
MILPKIENMLHIVKPRKTLEAAGTAVTSRVTHWVEGPARHSDHAVHRHAPQRRRSSGRSASTTAGSSSADTTGKALRLPLLDVLKKGRRIEELPIAEASPRVIGVALKAARAIGQGLYGVDIKESNGSIVVIEINDNPNLEHGVEDQVGKDEVWTRLLNWFIKRIAG